MPTATQAIREVMRSRPAAPAVLQPCHIDARSVENEPLPQMVALYPRLRSAEDRFAEAIPLKDEVLFPRTVTMGEAWMRGGAR